MCNALASVVAAVLACPDEATHLWYHLFCPDRLTGTQITGFLVRLTINCILTDWLLFTVGFKNQRGKAV